MSSTCPFGSRWKGMAWEAALAVKRGLLGAGPFLAPCSGNSFNSVNLGSVLYEVGGNKVMYPK